MSAVQYRNKYTHQIIFLVANDPALDASPRWEVVNSGQASVAAHESDHTDVHGISDTALLETISGATSLITSHVVASDPHGDRANTTTQIAAHTAVTTSVHGIANTANLETTSGAATKVSDHAAAADPHADRSWVTGQLQGSAARCSTLPRMCASNNIALASGSLLLGYFTAASALPYTTLAVVSGTATTVTSCTLTKVALYSVDGSGNLTLIAAGASNTAMLASTSTLYTSAITAGTLTAGARYAIGILSIASTAGSLRGQASAPGFNNSLLPVLATQLTGQTDIPSSITAGSLSAASNFIWGAVY